MGKRNPDQVKRDLIAADVSEDIATKLSKGAGLHNKDANKFTVDNPTLTIKPEQQKKLFENSYPVYEQRAETEPPTA